MLDTASILKSESFGTWHVHASFPRFIFTFPGSLQPPPPLQSTAVLAEPLVGVGVAVGQVFVVVLQVAPLAHFPATQATGVGVGVGGTRQAQVLSAAPVSFIFFCPAVVQFCTLHST